MAAQNQRDKLLSKSDSLKKSLKQNIDELKNNSENITKMALVGGGVALGGYLLYRLLRSSDEENEDVKERLVLVEPRRESYLINGIKKTVATFLLTLAKQKLLDYIESTNRKSED